MDHLNKNLILENANKLIEQFDIRTPNALVNVGSLSGGNQQKVIIARELSRISNYWSHHNRLADWMSFHRVHP